MAATASDKTSADTATAVEPDEDAEFEAGFAEFHASKGADGTATGSGAAVTAGAEKTDADAAEDASPSDKEAEGESGGSGASKGEPADQEGQASPPKEGEASGTEDGSKGFDRLQDEVKSLSESVAAYKREIHSLRSELGRRPKAEPAKAADEDEAKPDASTEQHLKDFEEFDPDAAKALREDVKKLREQAAKAAAAPPEPAADAVDQAARDAASKVVEEAHPAWGATVASPEFEGWLVRQPASVQKTAETTEDPQVVIDILNRFKGAGESAADKKAEPPPKEEKAEAKPPTPASKRREARARSATTVPSSSSQKDALGGKSAPVVDEGSSFDAEFMSGYNEFYEEQRRAKQNARS